MFRLSLLHFLHSALPCIIRLAGKLFPHLLNFQCYLPDGGELVGVSYPAGQRKRQQIDENKFNMIHLISLQERHIITQHPRRRSREWRPFIPQLDSPVEEEEKPFSELMLRVSWKVSRPRPRRNAKLNREVTIIASGIYVTLIKLLMDRETDDE